EAPPRTAGRLSPGTTAGRTAVSAAPPFFGPGRLDSLPSAMAEEVLADDNPYAEALSSGKPVPPLLQQAALRDLGVLYRAATLCREDVAAGLDAYVAAVLPAWGTQPAAAPMDLPWDSRPEVLAAYHARHGCGRFARHIAFLWRDGALLPVEHPDPIRLSNLKGYEYQRRIAVDNTLAFLNGFEANNMLLYGDRGTGKSSTVKALLNEYAEKGLRMIEMPKEYLRQLNVTLLPYNDIYSFAARYDEGDAILLSSAAVNYALYEKFSEKAIIVDEVNPEQLKKAIKNPVEIENMRKAHIKDGLAVTRFMRWVKDTIGKEKMTELSAAEKIDSLRFATPGNLGLSFGTISAYGEHAALPHYAPTKESDLTVEPHGFLLVDSGGQYYEGTTDITRTIAVGPLTEDEKKHFALVLRSMLRLANAKFLYGCRGLNLDILARGPLWDEGLDYKHGTGHGVGYLLNVHEGPNGFRWKVVPERVDSCVYEEGMITSDEPGIYIEGSHGIRIENMIVCRKGEKNEYGQFMYFETLTCAPIDLDAIDPALLNSDEKRMLNDYHRFVYDTLSPLMDADEREWLKRYTRAI
ncbi:MAG: M24 family metallopeptidase, partial [Clostridium sp.]|nr:M24 family metallopeptidase [Clostridium sp.]